MRNAVIRKKVLREQALIRQYLAAPARSIINVNAPTPPIDWQAYKSRLIHQLH